MPQIDNISLAIVSLKDNIEAYLNSQGWSKMYSLYLASDPDVNEKEIVVKKTTYDQIQLPVIALDIGLIRSEDQELGGANTRDFVSLSIYVMAIDNVQLITLGNLLRRYLSDLTYNIKNTQIRRQPTVGVGLIYNVEFINISAPNSDKIYEKHSAIINAELELSSNNMLS